MYIVDWICEWSFRRTKNYEFVYNAFHDNDHLIVHSLGNEFSTYNTLTRSASNENDFFSQLRLIFEQWLTKEKRTKSQHMNLTFDLRGGVFIFVLVCCKYSWKENFCRSDLIRSSGEPFRALYENINGFSFRNIWLKWVSCFKWPSSSTLLS